MDLTSDESIFTSTLLIKTTTAALYSLDKFQILRALEIFAGLAANRKNEAPICDLLEARFLERVFSLVVSIDLGLQPNNNQPH